MILNKTNKIDKINHNINKVNKIKKIQKVNIMTNNTDTDHVFELEKQLHEQYAVNNNSKSGALISLISTLLIAISGYGYVLYNYSNNECSEKMVSLSYFVVMLVITLLYMICVYLGSDQRMEQFIIFNIRQKYYKSVNSKKYKQIYPKGYTPYGKNYCNFVQGIYNILSNSFLLSLILICVCQILFSDNNCRYIIFCVLLFIICLIYRGSRFFKYAKRCKYNFKNRNNTENTNSKYKDFYCKKILKDILIGILYNIGICAILIAIISIADFGGRDTPISVQRPTIEVVIDGDIEFDIKHSKL